MTDSLNDRPDTLKAFCWYCRAHVVYVRFAPIRSAPVYQCLGCRNTREIAVLGAPELAPLGPTRGRPRKKGPKTDFQTAVRAAKKRVRCRQAALRLGRALVGTAQAAAAAGAAVGRFA